MTDPMNKKTISILAAIMIISSCKKDDLEQVYKLTGTTDTELFIEPGQDH